MAEEQKKELTAWENCKLLFTASPGYLLVNLSNFGDSIAYFGILTLLTRFLGTRIGMSDQLTGMSVSAFTGFVTLFMFGGGFVSDRFGVRRALNFSLILLAVGRIMMVLAPAVILPYSFAWSGLFLQAAGEGILYPALYAGAKEYTDARTATIGYGFVYAIMNFGILIENFTSPYIRTSDTFLSFGSKKIMGLGLGIDGVFWICAIFTALILVLNLLFFTRKTEEKYRRKDIVEEEKAKAHKKVSIKQRIKELPFMDLRFMFFIFILLPVRTLFAHQFLTMPDYVFRSYPAAVSAKFEWINGLNPLIIVIFVPLIAALTRKMKVIDMMIIGTSVTAATSFILAPGPNTTALITYMILFSFGEAMWSSRFFEYVADIAPAGQVGAYMGLAGIPWFLAKFTTGLYSGSMLEIFIPAQGAQNSGKLWLIYSFIACITPVVLIMCRRWFLLDQERLKGVKNARDNATA
ncbi:MAG: MFS transporter [Proteobacteria bacterium]|nr:MFS transporter [Pseudomonadota bacterium]